MEETIISQFSNENEKTRELYDKDEPFVPYIKDFSLENIEKEQESLPKSPRHGETLGSGNFGKVYGFGNKYVVKYGKRDIFKPFSNQIRAIKEMSNKFIGESRSIWLEEVLNILHLSGQVQPGNILNGQSYPYNPHEIMGTQSDISINIPIDNILCRVVKQYTLNLQGQKITIEEGDYICVDSNYSEYLIGIYLNKTVSSMHFISTIGFISDEEDEIYLERAEGSFFDFVESKKINIKSPDMKSYLFTIISHIYILATLGISHNDLHLDNILVQKTPKELTESLFLYNINGTEFYVPAPSYVLKIIDFGFAQKYTHPRIMKYTTLHNEVNILPSFDTHGMYDLFFYMGTFGDSLNLVNNIMQAFFGDPNYRESIKYNLWRPISERLGNRKKLDIEFLKETFSDYLKKDPTKENIVHATEFFSPTP